MLFLYSLQVFQAKGNVFQNVHDLGRVELKPFLLASFEYFRQSWSSFAVDQFDLLSIPTNVRIFFAMPAEQRRDEKRSFCSQTSFDSFHELILLLPIDGNSRK